MLALLSPAKRLDPTPRPDIPTTTPDFLDEAEKLVTRLRKLSVSKLGRLMDVSEALATENHARYQAWETPFSPENATPAVFMFRGDVYGGLDVDSFDAKDLAFAQKHLRILSGLYGLLRPLDLVLPYRLVMGTTFETGSPRTLYEFWGDTITDAMNASFVAQKKPTVINLASKEYFKAVNPDALCARLIMPSFREIKDGKLRMVGLVAKRARGLMARYIVKNRLRQPDDILDFDLEGYRLDESLSSDDAPVFVRPAV
ncbi:MAG: peroxide stress protein YaaA [Planctomycetota bacterium]|nr:peroxide stress protein YaaA [Planctomycetaceae bacterium]MDQ3333241.1 peroxide stress protein YaaA [Planctomycetota bacterium]